MSEIEVIDDYNCAHGKPRVLVRDSGILKRWTKNAKQGVELGMTCTLLLDSSGNSSRTLRLNKLMWKAFSVMNLSADDDTTVEIVENNMDNIVHQFVPLFDMHIANGRTDMSHFNSVATNVPCPNMPFTSLLQPNIVMSEMNQSSSKSTFYKGMNE
ncbi:unnamed protein product [Ilex paraguariensis]|uniref:Uncharacterized protein n=1 Tax=Ilex paraguariensis TaxID=185542 RepID=A0ABC8RX43_9AQUA